MVEGLLKDYTAGVGKYFLEWAKSKIFRLLVGH